MEGCCRRNRAESLKTALVVSFAFAMNAVIKNDRAPEMRDQLGAVVFFIISYMLGLAGNSFDLRCISA